jgi:hypothetical protein
MPTNEYKGLIFEAKADWRLYQAELNKVNQANRRSGESLVRIKPEIRLIYIFCRKFSE